MLKTGKLDPKRQPEKPDAVPDLKDVKAVRTHTSKLVARELARKARTTA